MEKNFFADSIRSLCPEAQWSCVDNDYVHLNWLSEDIPKPTLGEIEAEALLLQQEYENNEYQRLRAPEYPDFKDYLDGIVKGDQEQIQEYINKCLEVKNKYPKP